jgi:hypothetical protein
MDAIPPTAIRIGGLVHYVEIWQPGEMIDPDTGGIIEGPPVLLGQVFAAVEPAALTSQQETLADAGQILTINVFTVTTPYQAYLTGTSLIDFWDLGLQKTRRLEVVALRDVGQWGRYQEALCKERVGEPGP